MIRYATQKDIPALKALWKQAFGDEDSFIDRFFEKRVYHHLNNAIVLEEDGMLVSMLYALPCVLQHGPTKNTYSAVNLVGVATDFTQRHKGYMRVLLQASFDLLRDRGVEAIVLKPSNPQFYEKFGFRICNTLYQVPIAKEEFNEAKEPLELSQFMTESYGILRSKEDWEFLLEDGYVVSLWENGYAVCEPVEDGFLACEMVPVKKGTPTGYTMYKKIGHCPELPEDIGRENLIFEWY